MRFSPFKSPLADGTLPSPSHDVAFAPSATKQLHQRVSASSSSSLFRRQASLIPSKKKTMILFFASTGTGSSKEESGGSSESAILLEDNVAALRAAKACEEATRLSEEELGKASTITTAPSKTPEEVRAMISTLLTQDFATQVAAWKELKDTRSVQAFGSANLVTFAVSLEMLEHFTGMTFNCSLVATLLLGIESTEPAVVANATDAFKNKVSDSSGVGIVFDKERRCRHEAAHFCCAYWCGLPVTDYSVDDDQAYVEFVAPRSEYNSMDVAAQTVTGVAGLVGELLHYGTAVGGGATFDLLRVLSAYQKSAEYINAEKQQDLTRWGALTAATLLRINSDKYEQIVQAFGRGASLEECMFILEGYDTAVN